LERAQLEGLCDLLIDAYKARRSVLVMGAGRSGLVGRAFAMRLRHLGFESYVLGETITPALKENDLVLAISGSGSTELIVTAATAAKKVGAKVVAITSHPNSPLGRIADLIVEVPGRTKISGESNYFARQILGIHEPLAPLGTLFEDTTMIVLDGLIVELMQRLGKKEDELRIMHANIEL
ncbi:MAG: 6-phospho-3-hexuloisomerase, partial [Fervidicoccaceae archaeon]